MTQNIDSARLTLILNELRLPAIKQGWAAFAERADKEGWPAARFLAALAEHEVAERDRRRITRHLAEARLLPGKTLDRFDFNAVPMISKAHVSAICAGDSWIDMGANLILLGGPGGGNPTSPRPSVWPSSKRAGASCSPELQTSSRSSRSLAASSPSRPLLAASTTSSSSSSTTSPMSARIRPKPPSSSNSSVHDTSEDPSSSPLTSHSVNGEKFFLTPL